MHEKYYILNLWDYGTPAYCSYSKMYIGTEAEIRTAIEAMKKEDKNSETVVAVERYLSGEDLHAQYCLSRNSCFGAVFTCCFIIPLSWRILMGTHQCMGISVHNEMRFCRSKTNHYQI